jgi:hypothetical protein
MSSNEYNQLLKFLYFEGYADSYAEAEELLESMSDEKFEDLFESSGMSPENRRTWNRLVRQYGERPFTNPKQSITRSARKPDPIPTTPKPKPRKKIEFIDKSGASDQGNTRGSRRRFGEEKENFDDVVEYLFVEGFADSYAEAEELLESMSDEDFEQLLDEARSYRASALRSIAKAASKTPVFKNAPYFSRRSGFIRGALETATIIDAEKNKKTRSFTKADSGRGKTKAPVTEEYDIFESVVEYLFVEGFADTIENAEVMAENISEQWVDEILDEKY